MNVQVKYENFKTRKCSVWRQLWRKPFFNFYFSKEKYFVNINFSLNINFNNNNN